MTALGVILLGPIVVAHLLNSLGGFVIFAGLAWALPGAFLCARMARDKELDPGYYGKMAALYSALNIGLWFYLMARMRGKTLSPALIRIGYIALFAIWLISIYGNIGLGWTVSARSFEGTEVVIAAWALIGSGVVSGILWAVSLERFLGRHRYTTHSSSEDLTVHWVYLMPFAFYLASYIVMRLIQVVSFATI